MFRWARGAVQVSALVISGCTMLVEDVPTDVCASGKRWIGGDIGHEYMHPGQDCMACHAERDGPDFFAAGTVYGIYDAEGTRTANDNCFGLEGVKVTITGADGTVYETVTNTAGNFYFEGLASTLMMPYRAVVEYELPDGHLSRQPMHSSPSYGGCAQCHGTTAPRTSTRCPGDVLEPDEVFPVTPLFSGPATGAPREVPLEQECAP